MAEDYPIPLSGGPAFPSPVQHDDKGKVRYRSSQGMSLRDWFAGQALSSVLAHPKSDPKSWEQELGIARFCYQMADAMLTERQIELSP